jgi:uncharacterized protein (DUF1778 family)
MLNRGPLVIVATRIKSIKIDSSDFVATINSMARPTKADAERKTNMLRIRLTEEDRRILEDAAGLSGMDTSAWARSILLRSAKRKAPTIVTEWTRKTIQRSTPDATTE